MTRSAEACRPTLADVARHAGVSGQTVSRFVNDPGLLAAPTAERVRRSVEELGYRPNGVARALKAGRTNTIGLVTADSTDYGPTTLLYAAEQAVRAAGHYVSVSSVPWIDGGRILKAAESLRDQGVDGLLVLCAIPGGFSPLAAGDIGLPTVLAFHPVDGSLPWASFDDAGAASRLTGRLLRLGHRTVHHVGGPPTHPSAGLREQGWRAALTVAGRTPEPVQPGDWSAESGYAAGLRLAGDPAVTAVFCANDSTALGVLRAMAERGREVPGQVSVVGFDDAPGSRYLNPPLTTVRLEFRDLGERCVELIRSQLADAGCPVSGSLLPAEVVVRASDGPPPGRVPLPTLSMEVHS